LAKIAAAPPEARRAAQAAERRAWDQALGLGRGELAQWRLLGLGQWRMWHDRIARQPKTTPPASALGRIQALIRDPRGRDAVMATAFAGAGECPRQLALGLGGLAVLDPATSGGLNQAAALAALDLLTRTLGHVAPRRRGPGLALGAAWHWWNGSGAEASEWAESSLECPNAPELAGIVATLVRHGVFPITVRQAASN
jgi:hypothetical protein